jgi:thiol:disulfide interchange protein DsbD
MTGGVCGGAFRPARAGKMSKHFFLIALLFPAALPAAAQGKGGQPVQVRLVAEREAIRPGAPFSLGLHFQIAPGWHIYWLNPGDSGQPPRAKWILPEGFRAGELEWPAPVRMGSGSVVDFGYDSDVLLAARITPPAWLRTGSSAVLAAEVNWLMCREICIPGKQRLQISLAVTSAEPAASSAAPLFAAARAALPRPLPADWRVTVASVKDQLVLTLLTGSRASSAVFFPLEPGVIDNAAPQAAQPLERGVRLSVRMSEQLAAPPGALRGVLVLGPGRAVQFEAPVRASGGRPAAR